MREVELLTNQLNQRLEEKLGETLITENLMVDLETLGTEPSSVILSIGAAIFNENGVLHSKQWVLNADAQQRAGRTINPKTISWWEAQSPEAREVLAQSRTRAKTVSNDLGEFIVWVKDRVDPVKVQVWSNGASFDVVLIEHLASQLNLVVPWDFRNVRCYRTVMALFPPALKRERLGTFHNAEHDAVYQAQNIGDFLKWKIKTLGASGTR